MPRRLAVVLAPLVLVFAACSGDDDAGSTTTIAPPVTNPPLPTDPVTTTTAPETTAVDTTSTTTVARTTDATTSSTSTAPATTPDTTPPTTADGEPDWQAIVQGLSDTLTELEAEPDPERITEFCLEGLNDCQNVQGEAIRQFAEEGWRTVDYPHVEIVSAELSATANDLPIAEAPFVIVLAEDGPADFASARVIDADGDLVFNISTPDGDGRLNWLLALNDEDEWRVTAVRALG